MKLFLSIFLIASTCSAQLTIQHMQPWFGGRGTAVPCVNSQDDQTAYSQGSNVNGLNAGTCWSGAYVVALL